MSVPAYPAYRDSGVPWLGRVPRHWNVVPLKHVASFAGGGTPSREIPAFWNGDVPWVSPKDMKSEVIRDSEERITEAGLAAGAASLIAPNAVLIVVRSGILRHTIPVAINERPVALNQDMKALRLDESRCRPRFVLRLVQGMNDLFLNLWLKQGATVESIEHEYLARTEIPLPPLAEQHAIAAFLDRECGKIDGLVAEQERLIGLLKEKRQAVISHAVTKGLDPNAPMKDSGIAWLGQVPAHWEVKRLKQFAGGVTVGVVVMPSQYYADGGVPALRSLNVREMAISLDSLVYFGVEANNSLAKSMLRTDDLVAIRTGKPGTTAVVPPELDGANCIDLILIRRSPRFVSRFLGYAMNSPVCHIQYAEGSEGALQQHFNIETAGNLRIALPSLDEQAEIVAFLDATVRGIDTLTDEAERAIALLKERRAALISAAVTGKIDVRGLVSPAEAQAA
jgi:type I restriction enzyme, S subunit